MWKRYENQNRRGRRERRGGERRTRENETKKNLTSGASIALQVRKFDLQTAERNQCKTPRQKWNWKG